MRRIFSTSDQYVHESYGKVLHSGPGKIYTLIVTCSSTTAAAVTVYDNTAASGTVLFKANVAAYAPLVIHFPQNTPLVFTTGLAIATAAGVEAFAITEAEE